uniref:Uncharacterized protein n=1 Tax=Pipistrellus kuhlii TaxID=59472 RepID=A0A7J7VMF7_PIPKU|nr:hypothetical protein mPipKuh1_008367 [Pipistrellus kuhlii]
MRSEDRNIGVRTLHMEQKIAKEAPGPPISIFIKAEQPRFCRPSSGLRLNPSPQPESTLSRSLLTGSLHYGLIITIITIIIIITLITITIIIIITIIITIITIIIIIIIITIITITIITITIIIIITTIITIIAITTITIITITIIIIITTIIAIITITIIIIITITITTIIMRTVWQSLLPHPIAEKHTEVAQLSATREGHLSPSSFPAVSPLHSTPFLCKGVFPPVTSPGNFQPFRKRNFIED